MRFTPISISTLDALTFDTTLSNGLRFVGERQERSAGVVLAVRIPVGIKDDPTGKFGLCSLVKETLFKGTQRKNARKLADAFDLYGIRHSEYISTENMTFQIQCLAEHLDVAVGLLKEVLAEPTFPKNECETSILQAVQELKHLNDDSLSKVFVTLKELYFGSTWGHTELGRESSLACILREDIESFWKTHFVSQDACVTAVGKFDPHVLQKQMGDILRPSAKNESLRLKTLKSIEPEIPSTQRVHHEIKECEQTQIALAFGGVSRTSPYYEAARLAVNVLAGGTSSRLFTEIREKRGLVYSVGAQMGFLRKVGLIAIYAGTTAPLARQTFALMRSELARLGSDLTQEELDRARIGVKSNLLMDQESTHSRAREILECIFYEDRLVSVPEMIERIESVKLRQVREYWSAYPPEPFTLASIGREAIWG